MRLAATLAKTGLLTLTISFLGVSASATSASAEMSTGSIETTVSTRALAFAPPKPEPVFETVDMSVVEVIPAITVVQPMQAGTYRNTSFFGPRWGSFHMGTDYAAPLGTPIHAIADGEVIWAGDGRDGRSGKLIIIHHVIDGQDVYSWYGHMYTDGVYVSEGDHVSAGQMIAGVGSNGRSTGPHLHFEIHTGELGNAVDPLQYLEDAQAGFPTAG